MYYLQIIIIIIIIIITIIIIIFIIIINYVFSWNVNYFKFQQNWEF